MKMYKMTSKTQSVGEGSKIYRSFRMCLNLKDYLFKTNSYRSGYMNPMVTTNQKPIIDTQKQERKEHKHTTSPPNHKNKNKKEAIQTSG